MTPTREPGTNNDPLVCLLPTGSAREETGGISHLFEHIFLAKLQERHKGSRLSGYTTEDYVILFSTGITPGQVMETFCRFHLEDREFETHKERLIEEIEEKSNCLEEAFFSFIWRGTPYEKSPLGTRESVSAITPVLLDNFQRELFDRTIYFFSKKGLEKTAGKKPMPTTPPFPGRLERKTGRYPGNKKNYFIYFFQDKVETWHLLARILKELNPDKHIQLSEKKEKSALILEEGMTLPDRFSIESRRRSALGKIAGDILGMKADFNERALNELESNYFYGKSWQTRINLLLGAGNRKLLKLAESLEKVHNN